MSKRSFRIALAVVLATMIVVAGVATYVVKEALGYPIRQHAGSGSDVQVVIERGMNFPRIAELLHAKGVIEKPRWFRLYAMHRGVTTKVRTGNYVLRDDWTPEKVLDELLKGVVDVTVSVTIQEGLHFLEVFDIIEKAGIAKASELEALARDGEYLASIGIEGLTVEGYLFPETYRFTKPTPPKKVVETMVNQFRVTWQRVRRKNPEGLERTRKKLGWSDHEILIMASIVEKEAVASEERPRIAQTFINRITDPSFRPARLDTDPTIRYGCTIPLKKSDGCKKWDPTQRLRRAQLDDVDNPYNTYQHEGLPPGPIANPGEESLAATIDPDGSKYFFFVARNDGTHVFSRTRAEHERAVDKFQR